MKLKALTLATAMALTALAAQTPARADTLVLNGWVFADNANLQFNISSIPGRGDLNNEWAGEFSGSLTTGANSQSFQTYCVDLWQYFNWGVPFSVTQVSPAADPLAWYTPTTALNLGRLFNTAGSVSNAVQSSALQLAIWDIVTGDPTKAYKLDGSNGIDVVSNGGARQADEQLAISTANGWLANLASTSQNDVYVLYASNSQDQLLLVPGNGGFTPNVPEPETYAMMLAGLGMIGLFARRRA